MESKREIYGLVLCGGKSTRMGEDKGTMVYHGRPQREYLYGLIDELCTRSFYSIRDDQASGLPEDATFITDRDEYKGPFNGLLSAYAAYQVPWLVLACDLPLMDRESLQQLLAERDSQKVATAFATRESGLPEPLAAIWEPKGLEQSGEFLANGSITCPRKFLIQNQPKLVFPKDDKVLLNANSREEYADALLKLDRP